MTFEEAKQDVCYIVDCALRVMEDKASDDKFLVPNGDVWTYDEVRRFLEDYLSK